MVPDTYAHTHDGQRRSTARRPDIRAQPDRILSDAEPRRPTAVVLTGRIPRSWLLRRLCHSAARERRGPWTRLTIPCGERLDRGSMTESQVDIVPAIEQLRTPDRVDRER